MRAKVEDEGVEAGAEADGAEDAEADPPGAPHQVRLVSLKVLWKKNVILDKKINNLNHKLPSA